MELKDFINGLFGVKERHELPAAMMAFLMDREKRQNVCGKFRAQYPDTDHDYLRDYFQECMAERSDLMQDYTPESICEIVAEITGEQHRIADVCAGTGSLTIAAWKKSPAAEFVCLELSGAAIPFLLFNITLRQISAHVVQGDVLSREWTAIYDCHDGDIEKTDVLPDLTGFDAVISNPPYSLKWSGVPDERMQGYAAAPKKAADYAFALICLSMLKDGGIFTGIFPHGILFRGGTEGRIRQKLIEENRLHAIIGLPPKLFDNTDIPVCLAVFKPSPKGVFFIAAEKECQKAKGKNWMSVDHIETVLSAYRLGRDISKLSHLATVDEIKDAEYNLNISRFVDTYEREPIPDPCDIMRELIKVAKEIKRSKIELYEFFANVEASGDAEALHLAEYKELFKEWAYL